MSDDVWMNTVITLVIGSMSHYCDSVILNSLIQQTCSRNSFDS